MEDTDSTLALLANLTVETAKQTALLERLAVAIEVANAQPERPKARRKYQTQDPKERVKNWIVGKLASSGKPSTRGELSSLLSSGDRHLLNDSLDELVAEGALLLVPSPRKTKRYTVPEQAPYFPLDSQGIGWKILDCLNNREGPVQAQAIKIMIKEDGRDEEFDLALESCIEKQLVSIQKSDPESGTYWYGITDLGRTFF